MAAVVVTGGAALGLLPSAANAATNSAATSTSAAEPAPLLGMSSSSVIPGKYVVVLKTSDGLGAAAAGPSASSNKLLSAAVKRGRQAGARINGQYSHAFAGYSATMTAAQLATVRADPSVDYVQADQRYSATTTESKPDWGLDRIDQRKLPLNKKYFYTDDGAGVTAYVVDTGVRQSHLDFTTDVNGNAVQSRVQGGVTEVGGTPYGCDTSDQSDESGHGTHVAGTIGGTFYGVAKAVTIVPVRVLGCDGESSSSIVAAGLDWIVANHAPGSPAVANLSLTNDGGPDTVVEGAVHRVINAGVTVVIAAGNGNSKGVGVPACGVSPSDVRAAIVVGASTSTDKRATFSNYGSCVDLYAPGYNIESDWDSGDDRAAILSGTSMATPHVAGAVALYLQDHPSASPATVQKAIIAASTPNKITNVSRAWPRRVLFAVQRVTPPPATPAPDAVPPGTALRTGKKICSGNGLYCLTQSATDLALTKPGGRKLWHTGKASTWTTVTAAGTATSYDAYGRKVWSSGTRGGASTLRVTDAGNLIITNDSNGQIEWTSNKAQTKAPTQGRSSVPTLAVSTGLYRAGHRLLAANGTFSLALRSNGDLVLSKKGVGRIWHTGVKDGDWLYLRANGNLVEYRSDGKVVWKTGTTGAGATRLTIRNSGNLVLVQLSTGKVLWQSHTSGA